MAITAADLIWSPSLLISDTTAASNGGRPNESAAIVSGVKNASFPDLSLAQRTAGLTQWRKLFLSVRDDGNLPLVDVLISLRAPTPGDGAVLLYPGTLTDTQDTRSSRPYGVGVLAADADADDTSISVTVEDAAWASASPNPFQVGDIVRIDTRAAAADVGTVEYRTIASVSYTGAALTLGIDALENSYTAADGVNVAAVLEAGTLQTAISAKSVTGGVLFDDTTYPITAPQIGSRYQTWTITLTNAATGALSIAGDTLGTIGTGAAGVNLSPANPLGGTYFTVLADGWDLSGADDGDTLVFTTTPAITAIWLEWEVPAGAAATSLDTAIVTVNAQV
jgi:hypothetical protein